MCAPHAARLVAVRKAAFHPFPAPTQQTLAVAAAHPSPILVYRLLLLGFALPVALPLLFLFRNVSPHFVTLHPLQDRAAVVTLVRYHLFDSLDVDLGRILRVAALLRVSLTPPPPSPLRSALRPPSRCRPGRLPAASPPPPHPYPDQPRARPCAPSASARLSSSQSAHPRPPGFPTPYSTSVSSACGPTAPSLPGSASLCPKPSLDHARTPRNFPPCRDAQSSASPHSPPTWSRRWRFASPSPTHDRPALPAPSRKLRDAFPPRSNAGYAKSWCDPVCPHPTQSLQSAAAPANPPIARRSPVHCRYPQSNPAAATGSRSPGLATAGHT